MTESHLNSGTSDSFNSLQSIKKIQINIWLTRCLLIGSCIFFGVRLFNLIRKHAVNVLFFDQWDFLTPLFDNPSAWEMFTRQHGPHRQGLGLFVSQAIGTATNWDTRFECYGIALVLILSTLSALFLKKRLFGKLDIWDVLIPAVVLSFTQIEAVVLTPNPAHGALPVFMLTIAGLILTLENPYLKYFGLVLVTFFATYTGFGFFLGAIAPIILAICCLLHWINREKQPLLVAGAAFLVSVISFGSFFIDYLFSPVQDCFQLPYIHLQNYLAFISLELAMFLGFDSKSNMSTAIIVGGFLLVSLITTALLQIRAIWKIRRFESKNFVIFLFVTFSLLFAANSASGRLCLGLEAAQTSRYMTLLIPCWIGMYFAVRQISQPIGRTIISCILVVLFIVIPIFALRKFDNGMGAFSYVKKNWAACYVERENIEECNKLAGNVIYPAPEATQMKEKLNFLKEKHYNLFNKQSYQ